MSLERYLDTGLQSDLKSYARKNNLHKYGTQKLEDSIGSSVLSTQKSYNGIAKSSLVERTLTGLNTLGDLTLGAGLTQAALFDYMIGVPLVGLGVGMKLPKAIYGLAKSLGSDNLKNAGVNLARTSYDLAMPGGQMSRFLTDKAYKTVFGKGLTSQLALHSAKNQLHKDLGTYKPAPERALAGIKDKYIGVKSRANRFVGPNNPKPDFALAA